MPLSGARTSCGRYGHIEHVGQSHRQPFPALACVVGDQQRPAAQPGEQAARLIGQRDKCVGHPSQIYRVAPTVHCLPAVSARAQQTRLPVAAAVGGGRGPADRDVPEIRIGGVDRLRPGVMAVEPFA